MRGFHIRRVVKAADERVSSNVHGALDVAVASQGKIRQPALAGHHAKLHGHAGGGHRQIECVFEFDFLRLRQAKPSGDVGDRLMRKHDRAGPHRADDPGKLNVFDRFRKSLQITAILLEKPQTRTVDLAVNE